MTEEKKEGPLTRAKEKVLGDFDQMTREMMEKDPGEAMADDVTPGTSETEQRRLEERRQAWGSPEERAATIDREREETE